MTISTFPLNPQPFQFFDNDGKPLANGQIFTYFAGTQNAAPTYQDSDGNASNPNPIVLDGSRLSFICSVWRGNWRTYSECRWYRVRREQVSQHLCDHSRGCHQRSIELQPADRH